MKPFHYNQDPLYAAAAAILQGKPLTEEIDTNLPKKLEEDNGVLISALKKKGFIRLGMEELAPAIRKAGVNTPLGDVVNAYTKEDEGKIVLFYDDGRVNTVYKGKVTPQSKLEEDNGVLISALKEKGYTRLGMEQLAPELRKAKINTPLSDVVNAYAKEDAFVLFYDDATVSVIKNGKVNFGLSVKRALDLITSKEIDEQSGDNFKSLIGKKVYHGSPGYATKEVIASIDPHQTKKGSFSVEFESGVFDTLSTDELEELMNDYTVSFKSPHGGLTVIELQEDEDFYAQKMIKNQLTTIVRNSNECLKMVEDGHEFPEWAQSEIAVAEEGIVSVTEFMQSHNSGKEKTESLNEAKPWGTPYKGDYENVFFLDDLSGSYKHFINLAKKGITFQTAHVAHVDDVPKLPDNVKKYTWFIFDKPQSFDTYLALVPMASDSLYEAAATADIKKLINAIDDLSKEEFKQFLLVFADHMDETSKYARTNTGASKESIKAVSNHLADAAEAFKIESVDIKLDEADDDWEGENQSMWNPKERKELYAALASGKKIPLAKFMTLAHNYYKKSAKDHALNNLMTMTDQGTVNDVENMFGLGLKLKGGNVFATKIN